MYYLGTAAVSDGSIVVTYNDSQVCAAYNSYVLAGILINRYASASTAGTALVRSTKSIYAYTDISAGYTVGSTKYTTAGGAAYAAVYQGKFTLTK